MHLDLLHHNDYYCNAPKFTKICFNYLTIIIELEKPVKNTKYRIMWWYLQNLHINRWLQRDIGINLTIKLCLLVNINESKYVFHLIHKNSFITKAANSTPTQFLLLTLSNPCLLKKVQFSLLKLAMRSNAKIKYLLIR